MITRSAVLSSEEFLEVCRDAEREGDFVPAVELVGVGGYRIVKIQDPRSNSLRRATKGRSKDQKPSQMLLPL